MAASAGTLRAVGVQSGKNYSVDLYLPDAVGGVVGFNLQGVAASTSPTTLRFQEDVIVTDVSVVTGTTAVGAYFQADGASFSGNVLRYANQLNTLNNRAPINWKFRAGQLISATQI